MFVVGLVCVIVHEVDIGCDYVFMEFCGGYTYMLLRYGIVDLLPLMLWMIYGFGCLVCVLLIGCVDMVIWFVLLCFEVILGIYGDCLCVFVFDGLLLLKVKVYGVDVCMVYFIVDVFVLVWCEFGCEVVFFVIGFEIIMLFIVLVLCEVARQGLANFSVICNHVLMFAAIAVIFELIGRLYRRW